MGTQSAELPIQRVPKEEATFSYLAPKEEATSSYLAPKEEVTKVIEVLDSEEDFEAFNRSSPIESPYTSPSYLPPA